MRRALSWLCSVVLLGSALSIWFGLFLCTDAFATQSKPLLGASFSDAAEGVGAAVGAAIALLGAPSVFLGIKKSQAEIRKLELEALKLQAEQGVAADTITGTPAQSEPIQTYMIHVEGADNQVAITADPRLLGPLLLLLDFVVATIVLTLAGYLLNFGGLTIASPLLAAIGVLLFVPIFREARRLKRVLTAPPVTDD
jgi:sugar/nucleoside kinase (ribokinase family)